MRNNELSPKKKRKNFLQICSSDFGFCNFSIIFLRKKIYKDKSLNIKQLASQKHLKNFAKTSKKVRKNQKQTRKSVNKQLKNKTL
jgi:hypothetical protein